MHAINQIKDLFFPALILALMWKVEENVETGTTGYKFDFFFSVDLMPEVFIVIKTAKGRLFSLKRSGSYWRVYLIASTSGDYI